ncbi:transposase, partial [Zunongwangia sp. F363]
RNNITEVAYNVQSTVDAKHCLPIDYQVTNHNDSKAMGAMIRRSKTILRTTTFTALFDKGYHTGSELEIAQKLKIKTLVAIPGPAFGFFAGMIFASELKDKFIYFSLTIFGATLILLKKRIKIPVNDNKFD